MKVLQLTPFAPPPGQLSISWSDSQSNSGFSFLIIAGDLYDGDWRDHRTGLFFVSQMGRLNRAGIPVYLLYGNHDARSQITRRLTLPANVHVFASRKPQSFEIDDLNVFLHGQSFRQRVVTDNLALNYPKPVAGAFNIGVPAHGTRRHGRT